MLQALEELNFLGLQTPVVKEIAVHPDLLSARTSRWINVADSRQSSDKEMI